MTSEILVNILAFHHFGAKPLQPGMTDCYRKISNISRTQNQNLNDSRLIMQLPFPNALKPGVKSRMKM